MEFSQKLRSIRKKNGISQEELANQLNVSRQAVSRWESGQGFPETDKLLMIANIFSISLDYLLKNSGEENADSEDDAGYYVSRETANGYLAMKKSGARRIALGVAIIVLSLSFSMLFEDAIGTFLFFIGIAIGVSILALQGFQPKRYENIENQPLIFDADFLREFRTRYAAECKKYGLCVVVGILLIIASYALNVLIEDILVLASQYEAIYPVLWASAIAIFIISGSAINAGGVIAKNSEHIDELKKEKKSSWIYGAGFLIAIAIFLLSGILWGKWHPGWVVFPVAALICTAVSIWKNSKE